ncbi:ABC transporter ATP-binding protein/permease [uncultured Ruthenibacterium sp.]|uniref:ABC transporter ATP-binding protein/permease n=1 Tax=uncultured Ruthenibacterium sp. TaxID=1905347 RepID=UPI00349EA625
MMDKRLIRTVGESKKYIAANVGLQWIALLANIALSFSISVTIQYLIEGKQVQWPSLVLISLTALLARVVCTIGAGRMSYQSSRTVKQVLRRRIFEKLLRLGAGYDRQVPSSEVVQVTVEGVDQLETYFGAYLPQFFYSLLAPLTLFVVLSQVSLSTAAILFVCVPLIPIAIAAVQTLAKKLLRKYWGEYTALGDTFLENLQGLTTLKIYNADAYQNEKMNQEAERFRKITMRVLTMQLNSITIMDLVAYGGAALGIVTAILQVQSHHIGLAGGLAIVLLSAEFFLPMRQLGSFFHIAMNGMAASEKIFHLLDLPEPPPAVQSIPKVPNDVIFENVHFSYDEDREILHGTNLVLFAGQLTALVGSSGSGKSTLATLLAGRVKNYSGKITIGGKELSKINDGSLVDYVTYIGHNSYLFKGTVRENLLMGNPHAEESQLWQALEQTRLDQFVKINGGLDMALSERGANLSGGQRQRLALARALLHDTPVYIFDEATSNIDVESENAIWETIHRLAGAKTVLVISHRLANVVEADTIYVLQNGTIVESGSHDSLLKKNGTYCVLWNSQKELEEFDRKEDAV